MKKLLIPMGLAFVGLGGGLFAGQALRPPEPVARATANEPDDGVAVKSRDSERRTAADTEFVKLDRQFVVPVVDEKKVQSLMVLSLAVEVDLGETQTVFDREPKLRDEFLRVLFTHAQSGGFSGVFIEPLVMDDLRASLGARAHEVLGDMARSVLITNMIRQDL